MRVFYGLIITAVILMIGACALKAYKKEGALARVVFLYELGAFICGIIFLVYIYVFQELPLQCCARDLLWRALTGYLYFLCIIPSIIQACLRALWV